MGPCPSWENSIACSNLRAPSWATRRPQRNQGYAVYGGPDDPEDSTSPYHWQFWVGTGTGFVRLTEQKPYKHPANDQGVPNPGPSIVNAPTYLAFTYDGSQAMLYAYTEDTDFDFARYDLNVVPYSAAGQVDLFIGISGPSRRALFSPPGRTSSYIPFMGESWRSRFTTRS